MTNTQSVHTSSKIPSGEKTNPERSDLNCSGLQCIVAIPVRFIENLLSPTLALPRAAQEMQQTVIDMASSASNGLRETLRDTAETGASILNGIQHASQQSNVALSDLSSGLKKSKNAVNEINTAIKDTTQAISTTVETTRSVFNGLAKAGQFMDKVAETGRGLGETASRTAAFFKFVTHRDNKKLMPTLNKDAIAAKTDE